MRRIVAISLVLAVAFGAVGGSAWLGEGRLAATLAQDASPEATDTSCPVTTDEENVAVALLYIDEVRNAQNLAVVAEIFAPNHVHHRAVGDDEQGIESRLASLAEWHAAFPDLQHQVEDVIAAGDRVVIRYTAQGTHGGEFQGIAPSGQPVTWTGIFIFRIECGRLAETWVETNALAQIRQAAATPTPE